MKKILVVEDTESIREEIVDLLKLEGFDVLEAIDGLDGLDKARTGNPDVIISDILMPKLDGYQMLKELRKHNRTEAIPLIFLTAKAEKKDIRDGMNLGAEDYLIKPLSSKDLITSVNNKIKKQEIFNKKINKLKINISRSLPHELRSSLNSILAYSSLLKDSTADKYSKWDIKEMATQINLGGWRLHRVMENFILYSFLTIEESLPTKTRSNTPSIYTKEIIENKVKEIGKSQNRLSDITIELSEFKLNIQKEDLNKIIEELINNGIKFSVPGGDIKISSGKEKQSFFISVRNEGIGMSEGNIQDIGGFMQFDRDIMEQQGLGLGLSIVYLLTSIYNGEVEIDSDPANYFNIKLRFPM